MADMREVNSDLVGAAGQQSALDQRRRADDSGAEPPLDPIAGDRRPAAGFRHHRHLLRLEGLRPILPTISPAAGAGTPQTNAL